MKLFSSLIKINRNLISNIFPQWTSESLNDLVERSALLPDFTKRSHRVKIIFLTFIFFIILLNSLGLECTRSLLLEQNDSTGSIGRLIYVVGGILGGEIVFTRCWLFKRKLTGQIAFYSLANKCPPRILKKCVLSCKVFIVITSLSVAMIYLPLLVIQLVNEETWRGRLILIFWLLSTGHLYRTHIMDMLIVHSMAAAGFFTVRDKILRFKSNIIFLSRERNNIVQEVVYLKRSLASLQEVIDSLSDLNPLVSCLMITQKLAVAPTAAYWVYLTSVQETDVMLSCIRVISLIGSFSYLLRGYVIINFLALNKLESMKIYTEMASTIARSRVSLYTKVILNRLICCFDRTNNILAARDSFKIISRIDIVSSLLITFQLVLLLFTFKGNN